MNSSINHNFLQFKNNKFNNHSTKFLTQNIEIDQIGIVDFRFILKKSNAMKILGEKFILLENEMNKKIKK